MFDMNSSLPFKLGSVQGWDVEHFCMTSTRREKHSWASCCCPRTKDLNISANILLRIMKSEKG
jgi:hypothetical protein